MKKLEFTVELEGQKGSSVAALRAPFDVQEVFGTKGRVPVRGTINGFKFRSSLMPMRGCHRMVVNQTMRNGAGVKAGDKVKVMIERDDAPRTVEVPPELKKELGKSTAARENWEKLSYTFQKEMVRSFTEPKQEQTRQRKLARVIDILKTGKKWPGY
jgi:hypothetical protein